ncbi:fibronectin type III domain-containing protein [Streptomyces sp. NPDC051940]|uniref:fibronectin type III domain-containing protein n=1 Tax=Streptomyces sp. NPDC051940 TaxID=3155675 RepID=UPI00343B1C6C
MRRLPLGACAALLALVLLPLQNAAAAAPDQPHRAAAATAEPDAKTDPSPKPGPSAKPGPTPEKDPVGKESRAPQGGRPVLRPAAGQYVTLPGTPLLARTLTAGETAVTSAAGLTGLPAPAEVQALAVSVRVTAPGGAGTLELGAPGRTLTQTAPLVRGRDSVTYEIVRPAADGRIAVRASASARVELRLRGYYTSARTRTPGGTFVSQPATTLLDGRTLTAGKAAEVRLKDLGTLPDPDEIAAVAVSLDVRAAKDAGCVSARGAGGPSLCFAPGERTTAFDTLAVARGGRLALTADAGASLTVRLRGYYLRPTSPRAGSVFHALTPRTVLRSRTGSAESGPLAPGSVRPEDVQAYAVHTTADGAARAGCVTARPPAGVRARTAPAACFGARESAAGLDLVPPSAAGGIAVSASAQAAVDVGARGYFRKAAAPGRATKVRAEAGPGQATVSWRPPASDGGAAVTGYVVTASPGGVRARTTGATSAVVTGLKNGTRYTFTVTAANETGTGARSAKSGSVTPLATARPTAALAGTESTASLTVDGPAVAQTTTASGEASVFTFTGQSGSRIMVTAMTVSALESASVVLRDPAGNTLASRPYLFYTYEASELLGPLTLTATGTYTLTITPEAGLATYKAKVATVPADVSTTATVGGAPAQVQISAPGQVGRVTFNGTAGTRLFTRYTVSGTSGAWGECLGGQLLDPSGAILSTGSCVESGSGYIGTVTLAQSGTYTVLVNAQEAATGTLALSLLTVPGDKTVSAALDGGTYATTVTYGQSVRFTFSAQAGQQARLESSLAAGASGTSSYILDSVGNWLGYGGDFTVPATGTYTYLVTPTGDGAGTVEAVLGLRPAPVTLSTTVGGPEVTLTTTARWQQGSVTFAGTAGQRITVTCVPTDPDGPAVDFTLYDPDGYWSDSGSCEPGTPAMLPGVELSDTGTHTLRMSVDSDDGTGGAKLRVLAVPNPATATAAVDGSAASATTTVPGQYAEFSFSGTAGQLMYVACTSTARGDQRIYGPTGAAVGSSRSCGDGPSLGTVTLPSTGTYKVRFSSPYYGETGTVTVQLHSVPAPATATAQVDGPAAPVTITAPGQTGTVTFAGTAGQRLYIACTQDIPRTNWGWTDYYLFDPAGNQLNYSAEECMSNGALFDTVTTATTGTYTLRVYPSAASTGTAALRLYAVPSDVTATAAIGGGATVLATVKPGQEGTLSFNAAIGDRIHVTCTQKMTGNTAGDYVMYELYDPIGNATTDFMNSASICNQPLNPYQLTIAPTLFDTQTLESTGTYQIRIDPSALVTVSTTITIYRVPPDILKTATPGGPDVSVTTTAVGQSGWVTFDGTAGQRLFVTCSHTMLNAAGKLPLYVLNGPGGAFDYAATPGYCDRKPVLFDTLTLEKTGTYKLWLKPRALMTGTMTVRLYSPPPDATATAAIGGQPVTLTTTATGQKARFTFSGSAGQRLYVSCAQTLQNNAGLNPTYQLRDAGGTVITVGDCASPPLLFDTQTLPATGTYTIHVSPPGIATGTFTVRLYSPPPDVSATASVGGPEVGVTTTAPGQKASVTFTGSAGQRIYVSCAETLTDRPEDGFVNYVLSDPDGNQVQFGLCFAPPTMFDTTALPADGTYTISVAPPGVSYGTLRMRLYAVPDDVFADAAVDGPEVSFATTAIGQDAYVAFSGTAGQRISATCSQTVTDLGDGYVDYLLLAPSGALVAFGDCGSPPTLFDPVDLPETGTYLLAVLPPGVATGSFKVRVVSAT